ncbi:MAG: ABC transporter ATP-binding protein [Nitrospiraceae bacterium]|nr:ABC transporter ATP-binding protein [Nitrospiraceae bacterium]
MKALDLKNICFSYGKSDFIHGMTMTVSEGDFIGLIGVNGSGKSTMLKLAAGMFKPHSGHINLRGRPIGCYKGKERARLISYLPQTLSFNIPLRVKEFIAMGLYPHDLPPRLSLKDALETAGLYGKANSYMTELSGGERRRAYIAMTLLQGASILLMDEPLANLDIKYQIELIKLLGTLRDEKGITVIMALHDINMMFQFDVLHVINGGQLVASGAPSEIVTGELLEKTFDIDIKTFREMYSFAPLNQIDRRGKDFFL